MAKSKGKQSKHPTAKVQQQPEPSHSSPGADEEDNEGGDLAPCLPERSGWRCCCCGVRVRLGPLLAWVLGPLAVLFIASIVVSEESVGENFSSAMHAGLAGLNSTGLPADWIQKHIGWDKTSAYKREPNRVGVKLAREGLTAKYPIILVPGFVTSGLELWSAQDCFKGLFRSRIWTQVHMAKAFLMGRMCWMRHLSLNFTTGLDPHDIRVRNAQGLDAIDFFFAGYDVWAKAIESLADIGYDSTNMVAFPYDWRLSIPNMELRDGYFTKLRYQVEMFRNVYDERVLIAGHSWGDNVVRAFIHWMEEQQPGWVDEHVAVVYNCGGPVLGVPKAVTSLLSGELRESAQLTGLANFIGEGLLGKEDRTAVWRTWGSPLGMLPIGGENVWGNETYAPDDDASIRKQNSSYGSMWVVAEREPPPRDSAYMRNPLEWVQTVWANDTSEDDATEVRMDVIDAVSSIVEDAGPTYLCHVKRWSGAVLRDDILDRIYSTHGTTEACGEEHAEPSQDPGVIAALLHANNLSNYRPIPKHKARASVKAYNPLTTPLPKAPRMRLYCAYGHGLPSERAYHYKHIRLPLEEDQCPAVGLGTDLTTDQVAAGAHWHLNKQASDLGNGLENGVQLVNGDGTVPLISLGALCYDGWRSKELNPHGVKVIVREIKDKSVVSPMKPRGGDEASSHVELLGNKHFLEDFIRAAAGDHDTIDEDRITSNIAEITERIQKPLGHEVEKKWWQAVPGL